MMDEAIKIGDVHPSLRPLVQQFLLKSKYPFRMFGGGRWLSVNEGEVHKHYHQTIAFYDPNAETMSHVGLIKWQPGDFGKPFKFRVVTRTTLNKKYRDSERRMSVDTADEKRALKEMLTHFKPFTLSEIAASSINLANGCITRWRGEATNMAAEYLNINNKVLVAEVRNLLAQGVKFATPEFAKVAEHGIDAYEEYERRVHAKLHKMFVKFETNGTISVLSPHGHSVFTSFDLLPTRIQEVISMLKLMDDGKNDAEISGMGAQVSDNSFWVIDSAEPAGS